MLLQETSWEGGLFQLLLIGSHNAHHQVHTTLATRSKIYVGSHLKYLWFLKLFKVFYLQL